MCAAWPAVELGHHERLAPRIVRRARERQNNPSPKRSSSPGTIRAYEANDRDMKSDPFALRFRSIRVNVFDVAMK